MPNSKQIVIALGQCHLFSKLSEEQIRAIADICSIHSYAKGEFVFHEGTPMKGFYVVHSGCINLHRVHRNGREQLISLVRGGESFAEIAMTESPGLYPVNACAVEPSELIRVDRTGFRDTTRRHPELALVMLTGMSQHLKTLVERLQLYQGDQIESRLVDWLERHADPAGPSGHRIARIEPSKKVLASELGVAPETLSRALATLQRQGNITMSGRSVTLHPA